MFNAISAHIKIIHGDYVFWKIILNSLICSKFVFNSILGFQQVSNLDIYFRSIFAGYKIYFLFSISPNRNFVAPSDKFHIHGIFQKLVNILKKDLKIGRH